MLPTQSQHMIPTHWGTYNGIGDKAALRAVSPYPGTKSDFWNDVQSVINSPARISGPMVRKSFLEKGLNADVGGRGREPFIAVRWTEALDLAAGHLERVKGNYGNGAIFGGSYGWASAGRFHHAQSQIHRFLNANGGYVRSLHSYSFGAAEVLLPHVIGSSDGLTKGNTSWTSIGASTELIIAFGGISKKNSIANAGGVSRHHFDEIASLMHSRGVEVVSISPIRDDSPLQSRWLSIDPNTDSALMIAIAWVLVSENLLDRTFLLAHTVGFERFEAYLIGDTDGLPKTPEWASSITGVEADTILNLARRMADKRTMIMVSWSLQRAENGEHPYWLAIILAAMLGQVGLPGGGFGFGYGSSNGVGQHAVRFKLPSLPQLTNPIRSFIPVARISDMLLGPGSTYRYNGQTLVYPDIKLIYWAGGNPYHHHQDLNRLKKAWDRPEVIIANESWWNGTARHADIVFPVNLQFERNDIVCSNYESLVFAAGKVSEPPVDSRTDYAIFTELSRRLGTEEMFTACRDEEAWLRHLYEQLRVNALAGETILPNFEQFWEAGVIELPIEDAAPHLLQSFREDPRGAPLLTPSGKIEIFSATLASFAIPNNPGYPVWSEPSEWKSSPNAARFPLHLLSNQPSNKLHSQYDHSPQSRASKIGEREPIRIHPIDAKARAIRDRSVVRVFNDRGAFLASAVLSDELRPGVLQIATGAWYDPDLNDPSATPLEKHGNPNVVTHDRGTSELSQACAANTCMVQIQPYDSDPPTVTCFDRPQVTIRHPD